MSEDLLNENGLTIKTYNDIRDELVDGYKKIYGDDIDLGSNTSDGQLLNIFAKFNADIRELIREVYNTLSPDYCRGAIQDIRFRINHLTRKGGTFTIVPITITTTSTVTLKGLDADYNDVLASAYGATDNSGNKYFLIDTVTLTAGSHTVPFRAQNVGYTLPVEGTIVNPITVVTGVQSVINSSAPTSIGKDEQTDESFAIQRERSTEFHAQNNVDAMRSQLLALDGVSDAYVYNHDYENYPSGTDADGIPLHYIWPIVEGGSKEEIAAVLYANCGGAGLKGAVSASTQTSSGQTFTTHFDRPQGVDLYISFTIQETVESTNFELSEIKQYIAANLTYIIGEFAETSKPTEIARMAIDVNGGGGVPVSLQISTDGSTYVDYIAAPSKKSVFTIDVSKINISEINL